MKWFIALCLFLFAQAPTLASQGEERHRLVCQLAYSLMGDATKSKLEELILTPVTEEAFTELCAPDVKRRASQLIRLQNEMDVYDDISRRSIRSRRTLPSWAYMEVSRTSESIVSIDCAESSDCLLSSLLEGTETLISEYSGRSEKVRSIGTISRQISQLHFPLSIGFSDDQNGDWVRVSGVGDCALSLSEFWNDCTVKLAKRKYGSLVSDGDFISRLKSEISTANMVRWINRRNILNWANETYRITTSERLGYCTWEKGRCMYDSKNLKFNPNGQLYDRTARKIFLPGTRGVRTLSHDLNFVTYKKLLLDDTYTAWAVDVTEERIKQAAVRLVAYLYLSL